MTDTLMKRCSRGDKCANPMGCWQPATSEYFSKHKTCKGGLRSYCKACQKADAAHYYIENRDVIIKKTRDYHEARPEQTKAANRRYEERNSERRRAQKRRNYAANIEHRHIYSHNYRLANLDKTRAQERKRRQRNRVRINDQARKRRNNSPKRKDYEKDYRKNNPSKVKAVNHRHLSRKRDLPSDFTAQDWEKALDYFHGCCAICERQLTDLFATHKPAADHWIPLSADNCPGTIATNILPLCHGLNGCNNRKSKRDPIEFLETEFGKRRAKKIKARIEAYFAWVRNQS